MNTRQVSDLKLLYEAVYDENLREKAEEYNNTVYDQDIVNEEFDNFDIILEYLISEGYADTNENALAIMSNMSEAWVESIVEGFKPTNYNSGGGRKHQQIKNQIKKLNKSGKRGEAMAVDMVNRWQDEPSGREENLQTSRRNKMKSDVRARRDAQRDEKNDRRGR